MGQGLSIKNSKYEVSIILQDGGSVLALKVRDRKVLQSDALLHNKRYKYFKLPVQIKNKYNNVKDFFQFLIDNHDKIQLGDNSIIVDLEGTKVNVPFQNINQESRIFCQLENKQQQIKKKFIQSKLGAQGNKGLIINISSNLSRNGQADNSENDTYDDCKETILKIIHKIMVKNKTHNQTNLTNRNLRSLIQMLQHQFNQWQNNSFNVPNMSKIKTNDLNKQIQELRKQLVEKSSLVQKLTAKIEIMQSICSIDKIMEIRKKTEQETKKNVIEQFLKDISFHFNKNYFKGSSNIMIQIVNKQSLLSQIDNMSSQLQSLRTQKRQVSELKEVILQLKDQNKILQKTLKARNKSFISDSQPFDQSDLTQNDKKRISDETSF